MTTAQKAGVEPRMDKIKPLTPTEMAWKDFVQALPAWQYHLLMKGDTEMILHDDFVAGHRSLGDIKLALSFDVGS